MVLIANIFFAVLFSIFTLLLIWAIILLKKEGFEYQATRKLFSLSLWGLFFIISGAIIFYFVLFIIKEEPVIVGPNLTGMPPSPYTDFPPPPEVFDIGIYSFSKPEKLEEKSLADGPVVFAILCEKNNDYDIMYVGLEEKKSQILSHGDYMCWIENCEKEWRGIYLSTLYVSPERYPVGGMGEIVKRIKEIKNIHCL